MTPEMRTRSPAFSDCTSASVSGVRTSLISSEGGCAPLPKPPPFDGAGEAGARSRSLIASLPCGGGGRSEEHTSELHSPPPLVCPLLLLKKKKNTKPVDNSEHGLYGIPVEN